MSLDKEIFQLPLQSAFSSIENAKTYIDTIIEEQKKQLNCLYDPVRIYSHDIAIDQHQEQLSRLFDSIEKGNYAKAKEEQAKLLPDILSGLYHDDAHPASLEQQISDLTEHSIESFDPAYQVMSRSLSGFAKADAYSEALKEQNNILLASFFTADEYVKAVEKQQKSLNSLLASIESVDKKIAKSSIYLTAEKLLKEESILDSLMGEAEQEALSVIPSSQFEDIARLLGHIDLDAFEDLEKDHRASSTLIEAAEFIRSVTSSYDDGPKKLSDYAKRILLLFIQQLLIPLLIAAAFEANKADFEVYWKKLRISNYTEIKESLNNKPKEIDCSLLKPLRVVTGSGVYVREEPRRSKDNILGKLDIGSLVTLLEKNKKWSLVEFGVDGEQGWISNAYIKRIGR